MCFELLATRRQKSAHRGVPTFAPGVEQQVQVGGGALMESGDGVGRRDDGHAGAVLPHDGSGRRLDLQLQHFVAPRHDLPGPRTATTRIEGHHLQRALNGQRVGTWRRKRRRKRKRSRNGTCMFSSSKQQAKRSSQQANQRERERALVQTSQ